MIHLLEYLNVKIGIEFAFCAQHIYILASFARNYKQTKLIFWFPVKDIEECMLFDIVASCPMFCVLTQFQAVSRHRLFYMLFHVVSCCCMLLLAV